MDAINVIRYQTRRTWDWLDMTVSDVTEAQANWQPPGVANSIAAGYAHTIITADEDLNMIYGRGETLLARGWAEKCGLSELPPQEFGWDWHAWATRLHMDWAAFGEYAKAVRGEIEGHLDRLTPEGLAKEIDMTAWDLGMWTGLEIFLLHGVDHPKIHGGEIACLKGLQGVNGWGVSAWTPDVERPA